jgi:hypothetical protein
MVEGSKSVPRASFSIRKFILAPTSMGGIMLKPSREGEVISRRVRPAAWKVSVAGKLGVSF